MCPILKRSLAFEPPLGSGFGAAGTLQGHLEVCGYVRAEGCQLNVEWLCLKVSLLGGVWPEVQRDPRLLWNSQAPSAWDDGFRPGLGGAR